MGAELTDDYIERTTIMSYNNVYTYVGVIVMHVMVWFFIFPTYDNGRMTEIGYTPVVLFCPSLIIVCMLLSAYATRSQITCLKHIPEDLPSFSFRQLIAEIYAAM